MSIWGENVFLKRQASGDKSGLRVTSFEEDNIFQGIMWGLNRVYTLATGKHYFLIDPAACAYVVLIPFKYKTSKGPVIVTNYCDSDYSGGTIQPIMNRDLRITTPPSCAIIKKDPTGTSLGTCKVSSLVGGAGTPQSAQAGADIGIYPYIVDITKTFLMEIDNLSGGEIYFELDINWFEH
jgi:hypothetical protein